MALEFTSRLEHVYRPFQREKVMNVQHEGSRREFLEFLCEFDEPAFVRRAREVKQAEEKLVDACRVACEHLLEMPRLRLAIVAALIECDWPAIKGYTDEITAPAALQSLHGQWQPTLRNQIGASHVPRRIRAALRDLAFSFGNFNRKWEQHLNAVDFTKLNERRGDYNRYFVIEKACALQSERLGCEGFTPLHALDQNDMLSHFPYLLVPSIR